VCREEDPPYLDSAGVELTTDDLVYVTVDIRRLFRGEETLMAAGSLALIFSFPKPGRACILGTFVNQDTGMRYQAKKIVERTVLTRIAKRFMRRQYDADVAAFAEVVLLHAVE
jgi:hypothetical protein